MERIETRVTPRVSPPATLQVTEYCDRGTSTHVLLVDDFPGDQRTWETVVAALPEGEQVHLVVHLQQRPAPGSHRRSGWSAHASSVDDGHWLPRARPVEYTGSIEDFVEH